MATVERMIAELAEGGELTEEGGFTLDREQARKKMRKFQLDDPHRYVLCLVRAAKLLGATSVDFEVDSDDVIVRFVGQPLTRDDLDELYGALFEDRTTNRIKARRELAVAMNAAMALDPKFVKIKSGTVSASLNWETGDEIVDLEEAVPHTEIHVRDKFTASRLVEFMRALDGSLAEVAVLKRAVWHSSLEVRVNKQLVSRRRRFDDPLHSASSDEHGIKIEVGILPTEEPSQVVYVVRGATASIVHRVGALPKGMHAVIECDEFRLDVSQVSVVRDEVFRRATWALKSLRDEALAAYARDKMGTGQLATHVREYLVSRLYSVSRDRFSLKAKRTDFESLLLDIPMWRTTRGEVLKSIQIIEWLATGKEVGTSSETHGGFIPEGVVEVLHIDNDKFKRLAKRMFGDVDDVGGRIKKEVAARKNEARWRARVRKPVLHAPSRTGRWAVLRFEEGEYKGEVAIGGGPGELEIVIEGALFWWNELRGYPFNIAAVVEGPLKPNKKFTTPHRDAALRGAIEAVASAIDEAFMQLAHRLAGKAIEGSGPRASFAMTTAFDRKTHEAAPWMAAVDGLMATDLRRYMVERSEQRIRDKLLDSAGFSDSARRRAKTKHPRRAKPLDLGAHTTDPRVLLPIFPTVDDRLVSLEELAQDADQHGTVQTAGGAAASFPKGVLERPIVRRRKYVEQLLEDCFPKSKIEDAGRDLKKLRAKTEFFAQPVHTWPMQEPAFELSGLRGVVTFVDTNTSNLVRYHLEERLLASDQNPSLGRLGGLEFDIWGDVRPNTRYTEPTEGTKKRARRLLRVLAAQVFAEIAENAAKGNALTEGQTSYAIDVLAELFPMSGREWCDALCGGENPGTLDRAVIERLLKDKRKSATIPWPDEAMKWLLDGLEALGRARLVEALDGGRVPLETLLKHYYVERSVPVVPPSKFGRPPAGLTTPVFIQDWRLEELVKRLFGTLALDDRSSQVERLIQTQGFLSRRKVSALEIDDVLARAELPSGSTVTGVVGVSDSAWQHGQTTMHVHHKQRFLVAVERPAAAGLVAAVNDDDIKPRDDFSSVRSVDESRLLAVVETMIPTLMEELASRYATLHRSGEIAAASWLRRAISEVRQDGVELPPGCATLPIYPVFPRHGLSGLQMASYEDIEKAVERDGRLYYAEVGLAQEVDDLVVALDETFAAMLRSTFKGRHSDYGPILRARRARALAYAELSAFVRREPPTDALVSVSVDDSTMEGQLWLAPRRGVVRSDIEVGVEERRVRTLQLFPWLECEGTVVLPYESLQPRTGDVALDRSQMGRLRSKAIGLYHELMDQALAGRIDLGTSREILLDTLLRMHSERERWQDKRRWNKLWNKLQLVPVFSLRDGRVLSLVQAEIVRPDEHAQHGLWLPKSQEPEPQPEQFPEKDVALELKDAEPEPRTVAQIMRSKRRQPEPEPESKPKPKPRPKPEPEPEPEPPDSFDELRERVVETLLAIRSWNERLLSRNWIPRIEVSEAGEMRSGQPLAVVDGNRVKINRNHPFAERAAQTKQPALDAFVTIAVYGAIDEKDDAIEAWCQRRVTDRVTQMLTGTAD